jgi:hypothetical protein
MLHADDLEATHEVGRRWCGRPAYAAAAHARTLDRVHLRVRVLTIIVLLVQRLELMLVAIGAMAVAAGHAPARDVFLHMIQREVGLVLVGAAVVCRGTEVLELGRAARGRFADMDRGVPGAHQRRPGRRTRSAATTGTTTTKGKLYVAGTNECGVASLPTGARKQQQLALMASLHVDDHA